MSFEFLAVDAASRAGRYAPSRTARWRRRRVTPARASSCATAGTSPSTTATPPPSATAIETAGAWTDVSQLGKIELQAAPAELAGIIAVPPAAGTGGFGLATRAAGAWWCPLTPDRALVICEPSRTPALRERLEQAAAAAPGLASVVEVTTLYAALTLSGPTVREIFARFCALDLRPQSTPLRGLRPGSVARTPGTRAARGRGPLPDAVRLGARRVHVDGRRGRRGTPRRPSSWRRRTRAARRGGSGDERPCLTSSASGACGDRAPSCVTPTTS